MEDTMKKYVSILIAAVFALSVAVMSCNQGKKADPVKKDDKKIEMNDDKKMDDKKVADKKDEKKDEKKVDETDAE
jgi:hypothetical protein